MQYVTVHGLPPVSKLGLGTMRFGERGFDPAVARAIIRRALELGITHFDTAEAYGWGRSERLLGEALDAGESSAVVVTSKYAPLLPLPAVIGRRAKTSRSRLGVPVIPLYLLHMPNPLVPRRVIMRGFRRARDAGVIGSAGVSNHSLRQWQAAEAALGQPIAANEILLNLLHRGPLDDLVPWADRQRRLVIAASPLGSGMLTGRYDSGHPPAGLPPLRRLGVRHAALPPTPANLRRLDVLLEQLRAIAAGHDATPAAIALAWTIAAGPVVVIPGASSIGQLEANVAAADIVLREDEQQALAAAASEVREGRVGLATRMCVRHSVGLRRGRVRSAGVADRRSSAGQRGVRADGGGLDARRGAARLPAARCAAQAPGGAGGAGQASPGCVRGGRPGRVPDGPRRTR